MSMNGFFNIVSNKEVVELRQTRHLKMDRHYMDIIWMSGMTVGFIFGIMAACFMLGVLPSVWEGLP